MTRELQEGDTIIDYGGPPEHRFPIKVVTIDQGIVTLSTGVTIELEWIRARLGTEIKFVD